MQLQQERPDTPAAKVLLKELEDEYLVRYDDGGINPVSADEFAPPFGAFYVAFAEGVAIACGGWRPHLPNAQRTAEINRMYVSPSFRRKGYAREILATLEESIVASGRQQVVLETGTAQPEALELYKSSGYEPTEPFGNYCREHGLFFAKTLALPTIGARPTPAPRANYGR